MSSTDDSYSMTCSLPSSLEQTPLSSLSAASSYSSLVNCDEIISIHHDQEQQQHQAQSIERKIKKIDIISDTTTKVTNGYNNINKRSSHSTLLHRHVNKLCSILEQPIEIHGQGSFPTLNIVPKDFLIELRQAFHTNHVDITDIRLNGGMKISQKKLLFSSIIFLLSSQVPLHISSQMINHFLIQILILYFVVIYHRNLFGHK